MSKPYRFAQLFSEQAKIVAATTNYSGNRYREDGHSFCPIGLMLRADGILAPDAPTDRQVTYLLRNRQVRVEPADVLSIRRFMNRWDSGQHMRLERALGVEGASE